MADPKGSILYDPINMNKTARSGQTSSCGLRKALLTLKGPVGESLQVAGLTIMYHKEEGAALGLLESHRTVYQKESTVLCANRNTRSQPRHGIQDGTMVMSEDQRKHRQEPGRTEEDALTNLLISCFSHYFKAKEISCA